MHLLLLCRIRTARDYALVLGMPGTGKTAVICAAVRSLLAARKTVLVTSYTNRCDALLTPVLPIWTSCQLCISNAARGSKAGHVLRSFVPLG